MGISKGVFAAVAAVALAACDVLLGLGDYEKVDCRPGVDCLDGAADATSEAMAEASVDASTDANEASLDAGKGVDAFAVDGPSLLQTWAQWPMPNPEASIAVDSSALLPNPMKYDAAPWGDAADGREGIVDGVTGLVWEQDGSQQAGSLQEAEQYCAGIGMRVPTRIELVSLVDFTKTPTIDTTAFTGTSAGPYWTSSVFPNADGTVSSWSVSFGDGTVVHDLAINYVRCVSEVVP